MEMKTDRGFFTCRMSFLKRCPHLKTTKSSIWPGAGFRARMQATTYSSAGFQGRSQQALKRRLLGGSWGGEKNFALFQAGIWGPQVLSAFGVVMSALVTSGWWPVLPPPK